MTDSVEYGLRDSIDNAALQNPDALKYLPLVLQTSLTAVKSNNGRNCLSYYCNSNLLNYKSYNLKTQKSFYKLTVIRQGKHKNHREKKIILQAARTERGYLLRIHWFILLRHAKDLQMFSPSPNISHLFFAPHGNFCHKLYGHMRSFNAACVVRLLNKSQRNYNKSHFKKKQTCFVRCGTGIRKKQWPRSR